ncbi:DUF1073 domain-containing protein [Sphingobium sp. H39-3-25]|uniref:phage portal protein n=1 Tax=Sphingobium arseniciresistens TaxID=3030834 RepID=UPI0023B9A4A6|nr:DUF1073 domain-containing protein [Sphingobium arseniciresistens]
MRIIRHIADGLQNLVTGLGTSADARSYRQYTQLAISPQQIEAAYDASPSLRKAITIPATDRIRAWRDWQADKDQIKALEAEEKRLQIQAKVKQAEILRGLGGGALILVTAGDPATPINAASIRKGSLVAVNVVSRWHLTGMDWDDDLASPNYGAPAYFQISATKGNQRIHPSRVVCFRAEPLPSIYMGSADDRFWGRGRVPSLLESAQNLDEALSTFSAIIKNALNIDIGVTGLFDILSDQAGEDTLKKRLALMITGQSIINGNLYDLGDGEGKGGEKIDRHQVTWTGIPEIIRVYAEAFSAASDIPVTRFWGTSAKGLNATGEGDDQNWSKMVGTGQKLETRPCLEQIDAVLIPSALGSVPSEIWWKFAPLDVPSEKEETDRFKVWVEAADRVQMSGAIPEVAFNKAYQNGLIEGGWMAGLEGALDEVPQNERFGLTPDAGGGDDDPSAVQAGGGDPVASAGGGGLPNGRPGRAIGDAAAWFNDATPRPLYVQRKLLNATDLIAWAKGNGFTSTLPASDMHVTVLYSKTAVDPMKMGRDWRENDRGEITVRPGGPRVIERLGENAVVLRFASPDLEYRHNDMVEAGGSHDWPEYAPHVTLSYDVPEGADLDALKAFNGELRFGPEIFEGLGLDWKRKVTEE